MNVVFLPLLSFFDDLSLIILILMFFSLYNLIKDHWAPSPTIALIVTIVVTLLLLLPYVWFRYVLFVVLVLGPILGRAVNEGHAGGHGGH